MPAARQEAQRLQDEAEAALAQAGAGPQAPGQAGGPDRVGDEDGQAEPEGLQDLYLLDGLLARGRQDAQCAPGERQEDGE
jgi:hypothetical protein